MSYRTKDLLEEWVTEFRTEGHHIVSALDVLTQDGSDGSDTGLVVVRLDSVATDVYMQPVAIGDPHWEITVGGARGDIAMSSQQLLALTAELTLAAALCAFLEAKSREHDAGLRPEQA
jgi:hypothetical protein